MFHQTTETEKQQTILTRTLPLSSTPDHVTTVKPAQMTTSIRRPLT